VSAVTPRRFVIIALLSGLAAIAIASLIFGMMPADLGTPRFPAGVRW
jgi:hypothetical protein